MPSCGRRTPSQHPIVGYPTQALGMGDGEWTEGDVTARGGKQSFLPAYEPGCCGCVLSCVCWWLVPDDAGVAGQSRGPESS